MADYIERDIAGRLAQAKNIYNVLRVDPGVYGLEGGQTTAYNAQITAMETSMDEEAALEVQLAAKRGERRANDAALEDLTRELVRVAEAHPGKTEAQIAALRATYASGGTPDSAVDPLQFAPLLTGAPMGRLISEIRFFDNSDPQNPSKKVPRGLRCNIYLKMDGAPPTSLKECQLLGSDGKPPYTHEHEPEEAGKTAHFVGVWINDEGDTSPMSETVSLTVQA